MIVFNWLLLALAGVALAIGFVAFLDEIRDRQKCDLCGHSMLDPRDRRILWEYKALVRPREDVAREFGISPARVSQISTASLKTLCEALLKEGHQP